MKEPELVTATQEELDEIVLRARPALSDQQYRLLEGVLATFVYVMLKLQNARLATKLGLACDFPKTNSEVCWSNGSRSQSSRTPR